MQEKSKKKFKNYAIAIIFTSSQQMEIRHKSYSIVPKSVIIRKFLVVFYHMKLKDKSKKYFTFVQLLFYKYATAKNRGFIEPNL